jgi:uncharacterized protein
MASPRAAACSSLGKTAHRHQGRRHHALHDPGQYWRRSNVNAAARLRKHVRQVLSADGGKPDQYGLQHDRHQSDQVARRSVMLSCAQTAALSASAGRADVIRERRFCIGCILLPSVMEVRMALQLRPNCEYCDKNLPPDTLTARICSYECTFCADCVEKKLQNVCPNCGGGFTERPIRPAMEWRPGLSLAKRPPSTVRVHLSYSLDDIAAHTSRIKDISPENR